MVADMKHLVPKEVTKRKSNYPCKKCGKDVIVGERCISVKYDDKFTIRPYGVYHLVCWEENKEKQNKL